MSQQTPPEQPPAEVEINFHFVQKSLAKIIKEAPRKFKQVKDEAQKVQDLIQKILPSPHDKKVAPYKDTIVVLENVPEGADPIAANWDAFANTVFNIMKQALETKTAPLMDAVVDCI